MSTISLRLPDSLHGRLRDLAKQDEVSINQFITIAVAEKMSALLAGQYLTERAAHGDASAFRRVLAKVPRVAPDRRDRLPRRVKKGGA